MAIGSVALRSVSDSTRGVRERNAGLIGVGDEDATGLNRTGWSEERHAAAVEEDEEEAVDWNAWEGRDGEG